MAIALALSQIIELSGGRPRRMRQFANQGIFKPQDERLGCSVRIYPMSEVAIACIVARLDELKIQSGSLAGVAELFRSRMSSDTGFGKLTQVVLVFKEDGAADLLDHKPDKDDGGVHIVLNLNRILSVLK